MTSLNQLSQFTSNFIATKGRASKKILEDIQQNRPFANNSFTGNRILVADENGVIKSSDFDHNKLIHLNGLLSPIQQQLDTINSNIPSNIPNVITKTSKQLYDNASNVLYQVSTHMSSITLDDIADGANNRLIVNDTINGSLNVTGAITANNLEVTGVYTNYITDKYVADNMIVNDGNQTITDPSLLQPGSAFTLTQNGLNNILEVYSGTTTVNNHLTILPNGLVGVGTVSPTEVLDINGDIQFSGSINGITSDEFGSISGTQGKVQSQIDSLFIDFTVQASSNIIKGVQNAIGEQITDTSNNALHYYENIRDTKQDTLVLGNGLAIVNDTLQLTNSITTPWTDNSDHISYGNVDVYSDKINVGGTEIATIDSLDSKQNSLQWLGISHVMYTDLSPNVALLSDADGKVNESAISTDSINALSDVSSLINDQLTTSYDNHQTLRTTLQSTTDTWDTNTSNFVSDSVQSAIDIISTTKLGTDVTFGNGLLFDGTNVTIGGGMTINSDAINNSASSYWDINYKYGSNIPPKVIRHNTNFADDTVEIPFYTNTQDLLVWYKFDENNFTTNSGNLGSAYDITQNSVLADTSYRIKGDGAANLDGSYMIIQSDLDFTSKTVISISFWIKITQLQSTTDTIIYKVMSATNAIKIQRSGATNYWNVQFGAASVTTDGFLNDFTLDDTTWRHYCFTFVKIGNTVTFKIYKNGVATPVFDQNVANTWPTIAIGKVTIGDASYPLRHFVDDLRIYDRELIAEELDELYKYEPPIINYIAYKTFPVVPDKFIKYYPDKLAIAYNVANIPNVSIVHDDTFGEATSIPGSGGYKYFAFTSTTGTNSITFDRDTVCDVLVVGGGGGGGGRHGAGGGAGGLIYETNVSISSGTYSVIVGEGGTGGNATPGTTGSNGENSIVFSYEAIGGGGGGGRSNPQGMNGGSGGGSECRMAEPGFGTLGQGNDGGILENRVNSDGLPWNHGGGGGAGTKGSNATRQHGGNGGNGREIYITGVKTYYAGGGGGGSYKNINYDDGTTAIGGIGGGGNAGLWGTKGNGNAGLPNTGGGGGGASAITSGANGEGGKGGSGIVIIRWYSPEEDELAYTNQLDTKQANIHFGNGLKYHPDTKELVAGGWKNNVSHIRHGDVSFGTDTLSLYKGERVNTYTAFQPTRKYPGVSLTGATTVSPYTSQSHIVQWSSDDGTTTYRGHQLFNGDRADVGWISAFDKYYKTGDTIPTGLVVGDAIDTNSYIGDDTENFGEWVKIELSNPIYLSYVKIYERRDDTVTHRNPRFYVIYGSNDGVTWTQLIVNKTVEATYSTDADRVHTSETVTPTQNYKHFAITVTKIASNTIGDCGFAELEFYGNEHINVSTTVAGATPIDTTKLGTIETNNVITKNILPIDSDPIKLGQYIEIHETAAQTGTLKHMMMSSNLTGVSSEDKSYCMRAKRDIWIDGADIVWTSDRRIKKDIKDIDDDGALQKILAIQPKTYKYIDHVERGKNKVYGFISQQVRDVIPEATTQTKKYIPNIYKYCPYFGNTIVLPKDFDISTISTTYNGTVLSDRLRLISSQGDSTDVTFILHGDANIRYTMTISGRIPGDGSDVFVYGTEIDDMTTIDKSYIYTLNVCATQTLSRKTDTIYANSSNISLRTSQLEQRLAAIESKING